MLSSTANVVAAPDLLTGRFEDEVVILALRSGMYYGLEGVGARVWALLQQPMTVLALRDALVGEFAIDASRCERDLRAFLDELIASGLIELQRADEGGDS